MINFIQSIPHFDVILVVALIAILIPVVIGTNKKL